MFIDLTAIKAAFKFKTAHEYHAFMKLANKDDDGIVDPESDLRYFTETQRERLKALLSAAVTASDDDKLTVVLDGYAFYESSLTLSSAFLTYLRDCAEFLEDQELGVWYYTLTEGLKCLNLYHHNGRSASPHELNTRSYYAPERNVPWAYPARVFEVFNNAVLDQMVVLGQWIDYDVTVEQTAYANTHKAFVVSHFRSSSLHTGHVTAEELMYRTTPALGFMLSAAQEPTGGNWVLPDGDDNMLIPRIGHLAHAVRLDFVNTYNKLNDLKIPHH